MASRNSRSRTQTRPISSGVWFSLFLVFGIILWFFLAPALGPVPFGLACSPEESHNSIRSTLPEAQGPPIRQADNGLPPLEGHACRSYSERGLAGDSTCFWWMGWMAGMLLGLNGAVWIALVDGLFGFMLAQGWSHYRNRRVDRRHVYKGRQYSGVPYQIARLGAAFVRLHVVAGFRRGPGLRVGGIHELAERCDASGVRVPATRMDVGAQTAVPVLA